jgi:hypothetical protein
MVGLCIANFGCEVPRFARNDSVIDRHALATLAESER